MKRIDEKFGILQEIGLAYLTQIMAYLRFGVVLGQLVECVSY